ncbi:receptor-type tyrosine-protein phosphatase beta-like isoform X2 [Osmerus mordax]|uniref:receptor-type tyrosine-protein phosphatase beta-like isoform X2 n=1 Tax=Osmerus mordax TaxID=8014 RepID=UPI00350EBE0B
MRSRISSQVYQELQLRCQSLAASNNNGFRQEFESLNDVGKEFPTRTGDLEANREKNRYPAILPYDHCRVRLSLQDSQHSDYINASFVPGGCSERDFVCTQGPLCNTIADFWRMVWEQNVRVIVMVTALKHNSVVLCDQYWPLEQGTACFGLFQVSTLERKRGPDYFITTIRLRHWGCPAERVITHYYYPVWPDHGVPKDASSLCVFTEHVRQHLDALPRLGPAVVHCSAGVGRSGTFVSLLWLLQLCVGGIKPDVRAAVEDLRKHRVLMVQNLCSSETECSCPCCAGPGTPSQLLGALASWSQVEAERELGAKRTSPCPNTEHHAQPAEKTVALLNDDQSTLPQIMKGVSTQTPIRPHTQFTPPSLHLNLLSV